MIKDFQVAKLKLIINFLINSDRKNSKQTQLLSKIPISGTFGNVNVDNCGLFISGVKTTEFENFTNIVLTNGNQFPFKSAFP